MENKRLGIYLRVSTLEQSTELQRRELEQFAQARGWQIVQFYEDKATGTNSNRPMLRELMRDARQRKFDVVVCWKLDRFFRSLKDVITTLAEFNELGIEFISLKDHIDLTTASGRLMMHLLAAFAEFEAALIKERVRAGLSNAKAKGVRLGRPSTVDQTQAALLRAQGLTLSQIARQIGCSKAGVYKTLRKSKP
ncbi:MAG: recombinase family protein [Bdellovibrionaceae bacterium]|nr:recombinase family protein [Pseudobdellovibrionaceae bacterium]